MPLREVLSALEVCRVVMVLFCWASRVDRLLTVASREVKAWRGTDGGGSFGQ